VAGTSRGRDRGQLKIQLVIQRVQDARGGECTVLWDSGAQVSLVTHQYAEKAGFGRRPASIQITGVGASSGGESSVQYKALLRRRDGSIALRSGQDNGECYEPEPRQGQEPVPVSGKYVGVPSRPHPTAHRNGPYGRGPQRRRPSPRRCTVVKASPLQYKRNR
jgi:hypothetical protein